MRSSLVGFRYRQETESEGGFSGHSANGNSILELLAIEPCENEILTARFVREGVVTTAIDSA